jgi:hypothetical protein
MTVRYVSGAVTAAVLTCAAATVALAAPQRDASLLPPDQAGVVTVTGCLLPYGKDGSDYALARTTRGSVTGVAEGACSATVDARSLDLDDTDEVHFNASLLGHWVEVTGRLERETSNNPDNLRELNVRSFRMVPVIPQRTEAAPAPVAPPIEQPAALEPVTAAPSEAVATTGQAPPALPKAASPLPAIELLALFSLAGGLVLRFRRFQRG